MRKLIAVALAALVLPLVFAAGPASAQEKLRLPFAYIFSGPFIEFGERVWNEGLMPGLAEVNKKGGIKGKQVEFYKVDVRFPETAGWIVEFRRLCKDEDVPVVFGVGATKSTIAIFEDSRTCGVPVLSPSSGGAWPYRTDDGMKDFGCCMFRYQPVPDEVMPVLIKTAKERLNISRAALSHRGLKPAEPRSNSRSKLLSMSARVGSSSRCSLPIVNSTAWLSDNPPAASGIHHGGCWMTCISGSNPISHSTAANSGSPGQGAGRSSKSRRRSSLSISPGVGRQMQMITRRDAELCSLARKGTMSRTK